MSVIAAGPDQTAAEPAPAADPVEDLIERIRPWASRAVDPLQIAACLETEGVTDWIARVLYGHPDVFDLAEEVYRRIVPQPDAPQAPPIQGGHGRRRAIREVSHGALCLLPSAAFPAALAVLGRERLMLVVVLAGGLGWVWAGGATWFAYRLTSLEKPGSAARLLRWAAIGGPVIAAALGAVFATPTAAGYGLIAMAVAMMTFQMASTLLVFFGKELLLAFTMVPAVIGGGVFLVFGDPFLAWSLVAAGVSIVCAMIVGLRQTVVVSRRANRAGGPRPSVAVPSELRTLGVVLMYSALAATFLLHVQARYLLDRLDIALALAPLLAGMGVVEWRARRFIERAPELLARVRDPSQFTERMVLRLAGEALVCMTAVALLALPVLAVLHHLRLLTPAGLTMAGAGAVLAGSYFLSFILAGQAKYWGLCAALAVATAAHVGFVALAPTTLSPLLDITVFLGSSALLGALLIAILAGVVGQAWRYRINRGDVTTCMP